MQNSSFQALVLLVGRLMLAAIFIWAGYGKLTGYEATAAYMQKSGVPGSLLPLVILTELGGGLLIAIGWQTRIVAFLLAGFTLLSGALFHFNLGDRNQTIHLLKNIAIAGGFLQMMVHGAGAWSVDGRDKS